MKVDTDGMVAIIQGLHDSGLAVTLVGHRGNIAKANAIPITHTKSSVETRVTPKAMINAAAQLCDGRYTSSYQIAHCNARPTSPCSNSPEFPRQRSDFSNLSTTQGNFEIGGQGNVNTRAPIKISIHHRNEYNIPERSLLSNSQSSRGTLAFVSSLRKYPSIIPERNYSSEFVQRIRAYTQAKNFSKSSYHSKLMRKLRNKVVGEQPTDKVASGKVCKGIQTHERKQTRRKERDEVSETRNAKRRRYRSASPGDSRDVWYKNEQICETYDYLTPRHYRFKNTDVRYLSDVTRVLKDTLRQIYDDQPQVCPNVQNRYSRHRREHHRDSMDRTSTDSNNSEAQVSVPMISRGVSCLPSCNAMPGTYIPICPPRPPLCCLCMKPLPCSCLERSEDEIFEKHLEEVVCSWLEEIPVSFNDKPQNQTLREIMVMDLIEKLKSLYRDEHFEENAKNEVIQCVNNLPMWCPEDKCDQDVFRTQIVDNLMNKIRGLSKDSQKYKEEISKWLNDISFYCKDFQGHIININDIKEKLVEKILALAINPPSDENFKSDIVAVLNEFPIKVEGDKDTYIDNFAEMLVDKIHTLSSESANRKVSTEQILGWLEDIPELSASKSENQKTAEQLANMVQELVKDNKNESDIENKISSWLSGTLRSKGKRLDDRNHNNLVKKLLGKINAVSGMKDEGLTNEILNILEEIPDLDITAHKIKNMAAQLAKKIRELQTSSKENVSEDIIKDKINNWLSNLSKNTGIKITPEDKDKLANKLLSATNNVSKQRKRWSKQGDLKNLICDQISQIFVNNAVELDHDTKKNIQNKISDLVAKNLDNIQSTEGDDIKMEIVDILEKEAGVDTRKANQIADEIISITKTIEIPRQQEILQELDFVNSLQGEVNNILGGMDIENKDEVELEISNILADQALRGTSNEETTERLINVLKNFNLSDEEAEKIAFKLMEMQKDLSDYHLTPDISQTSKSHSPMQKQMFKDNAQNEILDFTENFTDEKIPITTFTPQSSNPETETRFRLEKSQGPISPITSDSTYNRYQRPPAQKEKPYMSQPTKSSTITGDSTNKKEKPYVSQPTDPALRGTSDEEIRKRLIDVLKSLNLSDEEAEKIAFQLMGMQKDMSEDLTPHISQTSKPLSPMQKQIFIDNAQNEILDFTENLTGDSSVYSTKKNKVAAAELAKRVSDTISDSNTTPANKQEQLNDEVLQYFNDIEIPRPKQKEQAKKLVNRLQKIPFTTSTPQSLNPETETRFRREKSQGPISPIASDNTYNQYQRPPSQKENPYMSQRSTKDSTFNQYQQPPSKKGKPYMSRPTKSSTITADSTNKKEKPYMSQPTDPELHGTSDEEAEKNPFQLMGMQKDLSDHLTPNISQTSKSLSPMQKQTFKDNAQNEILDFTENFTDEKIPITTSTPQSSNPETETRFRLEKSQGPISPITSDNTYNQYQRPPTQKEKPYMSQRSTKDSTSNQYQQPPSKKEKPYMSRPTKSSTITGDSTNKKEKPYMSQPTDPALRGTSDEEIRKRLIDVLKSLNLSDEEAEKNASQLMGMQKDLSDHLTPNISQTSKSLSPMQKQIFIDNAQNEILDFTENLTGDSSVYYTKKNKVAAAELAKRVSDTISDSNITPANKQEQLNDEVLQYFNDIEIPRPKQKEQAKKLVNRLQKIPFTTSTPRSSNPETETRFRREKSQGPISPITSDNTYNQYQRPSSQKENPYMSQRSTKDSTSNQYQQPPSKKEKPYMSRPTKSSTKTGDSTNKKEKPYMSQPTKSSTTVTGDSDNEFQQPSSKKEKPYIFQLSTKTSTKGGESTNKKEKPYMSQPTKSSTIITGDSDSTYNRYQQPLSNKEKQYMSQLSTIIDSWLKKLPINFDKEDGKILKEAMIRDLVSDIVDRQKYLQLNPNAKTSDEEELEHLKYQVFRWLNKLPDAKELLPSIAKTRELMNLSKGISVPQLTKDKGLTLDSQCTSDLSSIQDEISSWFEAIPARLFKSKDKSNHKKMIQELADNIDKHQKNYTLFETVLDQLILEWLQKMLADSKQSLKNKSESLKALLVNKGLVTFLDLSLNDSQFTEIDEWIQSLPLKSRRTSRDLKQMERIKQDLMENLKQIQEQYPPGTPNYKIKMKEAIKKYLQLFPIEPNKRNDQAFLQQKVEELFEKLNDSAAEYQSKRPSINDTELQNIVTNPANIFYSDIENWVDNLPIFSGDTPEEKERVKALKQNIISKLLNKIGELNMKPDIFQDDVLYEDLLKDEINDLLSTLPQTLELVSKMESLKAILIEKVLQAKQKAQNEMEAHAYKQQLRDAISTTLPSVDKITEEEQVPFEILKDAVADAYINLHYSLDNDLKNKYKQKIADEINKFCNDYLKRYPASPMNPNKLNQELYTALQKVPLPKDDTIKSQVEQVRIKDQIHEWLNDILLDDLSPAQQLQKNKIVSVLANALHETEKEKRSNPDTDAEDRFRQDIIKWAKKLPLNPEAKANIDEEADKLIERLKSTEDTRRFSISTLKRTSTVSQYQIPPSALTGNDRAHLQRIRQRTQRSPCRLPLPICLCKDASVSPMTVDAGSQTEMNVQQPLSPNININEYNWDSTAGSRAWETQNGSDFQPGPPYPSMHDRSYSSMSHQQMSSPFLPTGNHSMASLNPPCAETQPCISLPPCVATQPPCAPDTSSYPPCVSPSCKRPLSCERQPLCSESPLAVSTQPCQSMQPPYTVSPPCITPPSCMPPPPFKPPSPCMPLPPCIPQRLTVPQNGYCPLPLPPCLSQSISPGISQRRISKKPQFQVKSSDFSNTSSPAEEYTQGQSFECQPRVTKLGSFNDDPPCRRTCSRQSPEPIRSRESPYDECKWVQDDDGNLSVPCPKRRSFKVSLQSKDFICDREEARPKCHCKSRGLRKTLSRRFCGNQTPCMTTESMKLCSKCCGAHCPHPSYLFFK